MNVWCIQSVTPKIAPFDFGSEPSNAGDSTSVQCLVTSGDFPIDFQWLFNGVPIMESFGITTAKLGKRTFALTIDSVSGKHAGNYTCEASNVAAGVDRYSAALIVNGILEAWGHRPLRCRWAEPAPIFEAQLLQLLFLSCLLPNHLNYCFFVVFPFMFSCKLNRTYVISDQIISPTENCPLRFWRRPIEFRRLGQRSMFGDIWRFTGELSLVHQ